ncbi:MULTISPECIES: HNH endonuclease signature motif containing protein [unclassified Nocardioides]|uniref:HNH endonuclease signature motif containing protein n=1 Tax=unclassified Nocardioides TaxID=2615069 RepID=UPI000A268816|nr:MULTISPECIES: HNH endonuclease signature motif containing protein [unclassified Nocardioides]
MATSTQTAPRHPVSAAVARLHDVVDEVAETPMWSMDPDETAATLIACTELEARVAELKLRVAAHADEAAVGEASGATSTAVWWAHATNQTRREAIRQMSLATALSNGHEPVRVALAAGDVLVEQAQVIVRAVEQLPADLDQTLVERAEAHLVAEARHHDAKTLRILGRRLFEVVAPEEADAREAKILGREEAEAAASLRLTMAEDGHGRVHGRFTLDTLTGAMLKKALLAIAAPQHQAATNGLLGQRRPGPERMGRAFAELIQRYPVDRLPHSGGLNATVVVTMTLETLEGRLQAASLDTGERISPGLARRLACEAGIIPAVLGGPSAVLDLGRKARFHTGPMRIAMTIRDQGCTTVGCDWPPGLCHAHHDHPWSRGGGTNVERGRLLCPKHHARAHDPGFTTTQHPGGKVAFTRRT